MVRASAAKAGGNGFDSQWLPGLFIFPLAGLLEEGSVALHYSSVAINTDMNEC